MVPDICESFEIVCATFRHGGCYGEMGAGPFWTQAQQIVFLFTLELVEIVLKIDRMHLT